MLLPSLRSSWFPVVLGALIAGLVFQEFALIRANRSLRTAIVEAASQPVTPGDRLAQLAGTGADGRQVRHSVIGMPASLILSLSITCGYCDANQEAWRRLASQARSLGAQVFWVSRDTTEQMAEFAWGAGGDVVIADPTYWTHVQLKLKLVPQTVVVDGRGQVSAVRAGVLDEGAERDLIAAIERAASAISR